MSMAELQIGVSTPTVIVGEAESGTRVTQVRRAINKLIATTNSSTFELARLFHEAKRNQYFLKWGFESYSKWAKSLDIKYSKAYYLARIIDNMVAAGIEPAQYEPVGLAKLRVISKLDPETEFNGTPMVMLIRELTLKAGQMSLEEVTHEVDTLLGMTEDESMVWINFHIKKLARENVVRPALEKAKKHLPQTEDDEGNKKDASDGAALEVICANFLADPNFDTPEPQAEEPEAYDAPESAE